MRRWVPVYVQPFMISMIYMSRVHVLPIMQKCVQAARNNMKKGKKRRSGKRKKGGKKKK